MHARSSGSLSRTLSEDFGTGEVAKNQVKVLVDETGQNRGGSRAQQDLIGYG